LERQLKPLGQAVIEQLEIRPGEWVLDVGCGVGTTPWALAGAVGPTGQVVAMDVLPAAIEVMRAEASGSADVSFICGDAATYPFEAGAFDVLFSRFGVMFFADPLQAFQNLRRALRPGGRLGFVCWRGLEENELDQLPLGMASPALPRQLVEETRSAAWFSFSDSKIIRDTLTASGFVEVQLDRHDAWVGCGSLQATVDVCSRVGALGAILREHPHLAQEAAAALRNGLNELDGPDGPQLRAATWIVTANTPS
jgi:ubiquinone/menaquinone biosynthesis C-methylase UbiE